MAHINHASDVLHLDIFNQFCTSSLALILGVWGIVSVLHTLLDEGGDSDNRRSS